MINKINMFLKLFNIKSDFYMDVNSHNTLFITDAPGIEEELRLSINNSISFTITLPNKYSKIGVYHVK